MKFTLAILFLFLAKSVSGKQHDPSDHALLADDFPKGGGAFGNNGGKGLRQQHWSAKDGLNPHESRVQAFPPLARSLETADWQQLGADIAGEAGGDEFGWSVAMSADGLTVAVGAPETTAMAVMLGTSGWFTTMEPIGISWELILMARRLVINLAIPWQCRPMG